MENGCGEIIKYGFLDVPGLLTQLENRPLIKHRGSVSGVIARCVQAKADIVEQDERESGVRALLNLGHTFGHGIEKASTLKYTMVTPLPLAWSSWHKVL